MYQALRVSLRSFASCLTTCICISALLVSPALAQVSGTGPSPASDFDVVLNLPGDETIFSVGVSTQINVFSGGAVPNGFFVPNSFSPTGATNIVGEMNIFGGTVGDRLHSFGTELNIIGGTVGDDLSVEFGGVLNISGGTVGDFMFVDGCPSSPALVDISGGTIGNSFFVRASGIVSISGGTIGNNFGVGSSSVLNISGGTIGHGFAARSGSEVNISGSEFSVDGVVLDTLQFGQAVTITDRDVTLSGVLDDGEPFSFDLNSVSSFPNDFFEPGATLTVTLTAPFMLGDCDQNGVVDFADIPSFIGILQSGSFLGQADCNQDTVVDFDDIETFIAILTGS